MYNFTAHKCRNIVRLIYLCIFLCSCSSNTKIGLKIEPTLTETIDNYIENYQGSDDAGISILVRKNNRISYQRSLGISNRHSNTEISSNTAFRLASISKPFVALATMQLYEQNKLNLDDSVLTYIPEFHHSWKDINIHQLLSHRSGIPDFINDIHLEEQYTNITNSHVIDFFSTNPKLEFIPDRSSDYSNSGYLILAEIIERISGQRFEDYMRDNIFIPYGMLNSYIADETTSNTGDIALNYADQTTLWGINLYTNGSDGQISSIDDMNNFIPHLLNGDIVSLKTLALMRQDHASLKQGQYGYGWFIGARIDDSFTAGGSMDSFESILTIEPKIELEYVAFSNGGRETAQHIHNIYLLISQYYAETSKNPAAGD